MIRWSAAGSEQISAVSSRAAGEVNNLFGIGKRTALFYRPRRLRSSIDSRPATNRAIFLVQSLRMLRTGPGFH